MRLIPTKHNFNNFIHINKFNISTLTSGDRRPVLLHERIPSLQQIILESVETPQRFVIQLLALVWSRCLVKKFLTSCSPTLPQHVQTDTVAEERK